MSAQNIINQFFGYDFQGLFSHILGFLQGLKIPFIVISLVLLAGIVYFMVFTDYLYYKYFEQWDEYTQWKKIHKIPKKKKKEKFVQKEEILLKVPAIEEPKSLGEWERIFQKLKSQKSIDYKLALVDADKLLTKRLEEAGIVGRDLDEKIKNIPSSLKMDLSGIKKARGLLKEVFLNGEKKIMKSRVEEAIDVYKNAFDFV